MASHHLRRQFCKPLLLLKLMLPLLLLLVPYACTVSASSSGADACWRWYKSCLRSRPLLTKSSTSSAIMTVSDVLCQRLERRNSAMLVHLDEIENEGLSGGGTTSSDNLQLWIANDWRRTWHVAVTGFTLSGPISHTWYAILEAIVQIQHRQLGMAVRMVLDAFIFSPIAVAAYFIWRAALEGKGLEGIAAKLRARWRDALVASWTFWPVANIINFGFVPVELRVLYNNMLSLLWTGYLSHMNATYLAAHKHQTTK